VTLSASPFDRFLDRAFTLAGDAAPDAQAASTRMRAFETILLLHLTARFATGSFPDAAATPGLRSILAVGMGLCFALSFRPRLSPVAVASALCLMLALLANTFPGTGNHFFLELWALLLLLLVGRSTPAEADLLQGALRWSIAIVLFYTGIQKMLYGTYLEAQYLTFEIALKPEFESVFAPLIPAEELQRLRTIVPGRVGSGPFRTDAPLLLLASNLVYLFEIAAPVALLWWRSRRLAVIAVIVFTVAIQSGAREVYFGGLLVNWVLLFWPQSLHRRAPIGFAAYYAALAGLHFLAPGLLVMR